MREFLDVGLIAALDGDRQVNRNIANQPDLTAFKLDALNEEFNVGTPLRKSAS